ncbi:hypothetical protein ACOSQ2_020100 [Xanthoceras sorbifolium]
MPQASARVYSGTYSLVIKKDCWRDSNLGICQGVSFCCQYKQFNPHITHFSGCLPEKQKQIVPMLGSRIQTNFFQNHFWPSLVLLFSSKLLVLHHVDSTRPFTRR